MDAAVAFTTCEMLSSESSFEDCEAACVPTYTIAPDEGCLHTASIAPD